MERENSELEYKQVIIVRNELHMPKGKLAAQVSHASLDAALNTDKRILENWHSNGGKKVILKVETEKELLRYFQMAKDEGLVAVLIIDAGRTFLQPGTKSCVGIGPALSSKIDTITGHLAML
ncbi:MAG: peptidyl-tRNA hydrolase Pth2 [Candidatus Woesearchaeota archaeon]|nr:peptidyl-tRNA hydrolase Pth2 [Candidatus Woesearchaeota archaeon]